MRVELRETLSDLMGSRTKSLYLSITESDLASKRKVACQNKAAYFLSGLLSASFSCHLFGKCDRLIYSTSKPSLHAQFPPEALPRISCLSTHEKQIIKPEEIWWATTTQS